MKSKLFALLKAEPSIEKRVLHGMPCPLLAQSGHRQRTSTAQVCFLTESGHRLELKHFIIDGPSFGGLYMHKWALPAALGLWIGMCPVSIEAQAPSDNVGVLLAGAPANNVRNLDALREGLRSHGWVEVNNVSITPVYAMGDYSRLPALAKQLVDQKVRIILAGNERSLIAAKDTGADIPIVVVACDPLEKLLGSLARPGGNATGISCVSADLIGKRFDHLKAIIPNLKRVALLFNPQDISDIELREAAKAGNSLGIAITQISVTSADDFNAGFDNG
jgi:putative ABC transport system substrate-binding protein